MSYDVMSSKAEDFINDEEILETLDYAEKHKTDEKLITSILEEAAKCNGLNHRKAAVLLACEVPELNQKIENLAKDVAESYGGLFGLRVVGGVGVGSHNHGVGNIRIVGGGVHG